MAYEPKGIKFFDAISDRQMILVADGEPFAGWLCYQHPDGQWVSLRKAITDNKPFPIQAELSTSRWGRTDACYIPWWLAEEAYAEYSKRYGNSQSLERLAERGGFGRDELLLLLRRES
jgi:hypothetical protein